MNWSYVAGICAAISLIAMIVSIVYLIKTLKHRRSLSHREPLSPTRCPACQSTNWYAISMDSNADWAQCRNCDLQFNPLTLVREREIQRQAWDETK